ncbi:uncharacterized protein EV154DRAFT_536288 [Mucor mucedo]|uniref:uncharacterized protein n=1 Tax=Mucor mucedo TaxID=29922 RepID=UPI00221E8668|nr:uncharacterized protein EV154DRAFT_536288 [Mucor mucedo]KAI7895237.1 hypothetical protein EV154DRAFT_536288 [Mucor mucedo]
MRKLRILCRESRGLGLKRLEEMGAEIQEVNYKEEKKLGEALRNVHSVILIPENSSDRLKEAENLIKAAKQQEVEHFGLMSIVGVDRVHQNEDANSNEFRNLKEYHQIEKKVKETFGGDKHCICRHQIFNQVYYFLAPQIEGENKFPVPVKKDCKWGSVNMIDVVEAVYRLARKQHQQQRNGKDVDTFYHKNVYDFTMPRTLNGQDMAREVGQGLGREDLQFEQVSDQDFKKQLERMREDRRFKDRTDNNGKIEEGRDGWWSVPIGKFLNEQNIETMMEFWRLANKGQQDNSSDDLKKILERHPQGLKEYFKTNREQFKQFK